MEEDIIVTLEEDDTEFIADPLSAEDLSNAEEVISAGSSSHNDEMAKAPHSAGTLSSAGEEDQFSSSSPTTFAIYSSEEDDESGSGISRGRGSGISGGQNAALRMSSIGTESEARLFCNTEDEHKAYKRMKALEEILETERAYVKSLDILNKVALPFS